MPKKQIHIEVEQLGNGMFMLEQNQVSDSFTYMFSTGLNGLEQIDIDFLNKVFINKLGFSNAQSEMDLQFTKNTAEDLPELIANLTGLLEKKFNVSIDVKDNLLRRRSSSTQSSSQRKSPRSPRLNG